MPTPHNPYAPSQKAPEADVKAEEASEAPEPVEEETEPQKAVEASEEENDSVPEGPAAAVLAWVGEDKDRAKKALEAEEAGQQRVGLTRKLKELAE